MCRRQFKFNSFGRILVEVNRYAVSRVDCRIPVTHEVTINLHTMLNTIRICMGGRKGFFSHNRLAVFILPKSPFEATESIAGKLVCGHIVEKGDAVFRIPCLGRNTIDSFALVHIAKTAFALGSNMLPGREMKAF
jgi:hypothetical protein